MLGVVPAGPVRAAGALHRLRDTSQIAEALKVLCASERYRKAGQAAGDNDWKSSGVELYQQYEMLLDRPWAYDADQDGAPDTKPAPMTDRDFFAVGVRVS